MSRLITVGVASLALASPARAEETAAASVPAADATTSTNPGVPPDVTQQGVAAAIGVAAGGRSTAGGLRVTGHYLYQMNDTDWFDGTASFTLGSGSPGCFRDRDDRIVCDHGIAGGAGGEVGVTVRRFLNGKGEFWPYVRVGIGIGIVRYSDDEVTGLTIPLKVGGGFRVSVTSGVAVIAEALLDVGVGFLTRDLGLEPQLGGSVTAGAEFAL